MKTIHLTAALLAVTVAPSVQAALFTDQSAFLAATDETTIETFDNDITPGLFEGSITFDSGTTSTKSDPNRLELNRVRRGHFDGFVTRDGFQDLTFDFGEEIFAFGGDFASDLGENSSLMVMGLFDGEMQTLSIGETIEGEGFFGVTSDTAFQSVTFRTNAGSYLFGGARPFGGEVFEIDNLISARSLTEVAPVPLPASGMALLLALGALGVSYKRKANA